MTTIERRTQPRYRLHLPATIRFGTTTFRAVAVDNFSTRGFRLRGGIPEALQSRLLVRVHFGCLKPALSVHAVAYSTPGHLGLEFIEGVTDMQVHEHGQTVDVDATIFRHGALQAILCRPIILAS